MNNSHGNNTFVQAIIRALFEVASHPNLDELAGQVVELFIKAFPFNQNKPTEVIQIPYKDITDVIFQSNQEINSDSIGNFKGNFQQALKNCSAYQALHHDSHSIFLEYFTVRYEKVVEHAQLAQVQRNFIKNSIEKSIQETQNEIQDSKAELSKLQALAETTKEIAEQAKKTYNTMFANYVTILGIFTAIIVTIFGGLNVVDTIISYGDAHFSTIVFLVALVLMCVVCLLYFLAKIILKLNGMGGENQRFTLECLFGVIFAVCIGLIIAAWYASPSKMTPEMDKKMLQDKTKN